MEKIISFLTSPKLYVSIAILLGALIIYLILKNVINKVIERNKKDSNHKKRATYVKLLKNIVKYLILLLSLFLILEVYGVDVSGMLVSLGVVGVVAGLALQDALKDIIQGFNIIADNYFSVGDIVKINGIEGKVIEIGLKTTKLLDVNTGDLVVMSNRTIDRAITISDELFISVTNEKNIKSFEKTIDKIIKKIKEIDYVRDTECLGLEESNTYKIKISTDSEYKNTLKRECLKIINDIQSK